ncbi:FYVE, RhoGEF and PH domain-containing protein 3 isoform X3 [Rousettus aegyptiacus]|uniref:FYVE, RhoGEF and PH domain-containing protein 3 isoform X3 n=1 Tax=Rousettus aegyptiacus TaxID=9407 RepID=UPI00168CDA97|nr:FYVE, RhoGEF and PH domain-containing protein 3 isoform X3 [Rousettus aegyptiacus]
MESEGGSSTALAPIATLGDPDAGPGYSSFELPNTDLGKLRELPTGLGTHREDPAPRRHSSLDAVVDGPPDMDSMGEQSCSAKISNRDSGIDSPSCSMASESFSCKESGEVGLGATVLRLHTEMASDSKAPQEEADSDVGEGSSEEPEPEDSCPRANMDLPKCSEPQKLLHIAQELLHTEETYVRRLHLLDQVFCTRLTEAGIPVEVTTGIFSNISSIYRFHGQFLLPELQIRITEEWDINPRLGDILQKLAPFLKMYGEYVKNFDRAMELVSAWTHRSLLFRDIVHGIQKQEVCGNLTLQHHMLEPVQRVPRYELLLKDYLKQLPLNAPDRKDAERSLELISTAANHSSAAIRKMEKMHKLLEVYERLGGEEDIVNPTNELIKEGHIQKLSAKNGTAQDRHLILFNSMILYCVPKLRLMGQKFSVREKMDISDLQVQDIVKPHAAHTFIIMGRKRSLELQTRTEEEKQEWIQVIEATIEKHKQNSQTFKAFCSSLGQDEDPSLTPDPPMVSAGSEEPAVAADGGGGTAGLEPRRGSSKTKRDKEKQGCRSCGETFNSITKRKHHCKLCGVVICGKCSEFKAENGRQSRVCRECFPTQPVVPGSSSPEAPSEPKQSIEGIQPNPSGGDTGEKSAGPGPCPVCLPLNFHPLKVVLAHPMTVTPTGRLHLTQLLCPQKPASVDPLPSLLCGPLWVSDSGSDWSEVWATISTSDNLELVLHRQAGSQDSRLPSTIPLSGCTVSVPDPAERLDAGHVWRLQQAQQSLYLSAPSAELQQQWLEVLNMAACRDLTQASRGTPKSQAPAAP